MLSAIVLGEVFLRTFWPQRPASVVGIFRADPFAGFSLQPNCRKEIRTPEYRIDVLTDAEGYRIARADTHQGDGRPSRILVIGDSFAFGIGVNAEAAFPEKLEDLLAASAEDWEVRNGAVGGYGPLRSSRLLIHRQSTWKPEILIHAFYVGNDFEDSDPKTFLTRPLVKDGRMFTPGSHSLHQLRLMLRTRSHLYLFLREHLYDLYRASGIARRAQYLEPVALAEWPPLIRSTGWPAAQSALREIRDWSRTHGVRYLVVLVPAKYQVEEKSWEDYREAWDLPESAFDRDHGQRVAGAFFEELGVPVLDLLPVMRAESSGGRPFYYAVDRHWTEAAHRLAADQLLEKLISLGWIRSESR
jgi:hypothetical protein